MHSKYSFTYLLTNIRSISTAEQEQNGCTRMLPCGSPHMTTIVIIISMPLGVKNQRAVARGRVLRPDKSVLMIETTLKCVRPKRSCCSGLQMRQLNGQPQRSESLTLRSGWNRESQTPAAEKCRWLEGQRTWRFLPRDARSASAVLVL